MTGALSVFHARNKAGISRIFGGCIFGGRIFGVLLLCLCAFMAVPSRGFTEQQAQQQGTPAASSQSAPADQVAQPTPAAPGGGEYLKYEPPVASGSQPSLVASTLRVVAALALVLAALLFTLYLLKRFMDRGGIKGEKGTPIRIVATKFIGPKKSIAVVEVFGQYLVVGISSSGINLLAELKGEGAMSKVEAAMGDVPPITFSDFLRGSMGKRGDSGSVNEKLRGTAGSVEERLREIKRDE